MKVKDLAEFYCTTIRQTKLEDFTKNAIECLMLKDKTVVVFGENGEFHYLYATPFQKDTAKSNYWAKRFEKENFDAVYALALPVGYWVYEHSSLANFYEFRWFETLEKAQAFYSEEKFEVDGILFEKAILYIDDERKDCIIYEKRC